MASNSSNGPNKTKGRYKLKLNSLEKIEELLQEAYDEANQNVVKLQEEINRISSATNLNDCTVDERAKFAKAINDYITNRDKALGRKIEIGKLMAEIHKNNGNIAKTVANTEDLSNFDLEVLQQQLVESETASKPQPYKIGN